MGAAGTRGCGAQDAVVFLLTLLYTCCHLLRGPLASNGHPLVDTAGWHAPAARSPTTRPMLCPALPCLQAPKLAAPLGTLGGLFLKLTGVGMLLACIVYYTQKVRLHRARRRSWPGASDSWVPELQEPVFGTPKNLPGHGRGRHHTSSGSRA